MALLAMALSDLGVEAISFTGSQSGILTDGAHSAARIVDVRPDRIRAELERGRVVIVAGFQGVESRDQGDHDAGPRRLGHHRGRARRRAGPGARARSTPTCSGVLHRRPARGARGAADRALSYRACSTPRPPRRTGAARALRGPGGARSACRSPCARRSTSRPAPGSWRKRWRPDASRRSRTRPDARSRSPRAPPADAARPAASSRRWRRPSPGSSWSPTSRQTEAHGALVWIGEPRRRRGAQGRLPRACAGRAASGSSRCSTTSRSSRWSDSGSARRRRRGPRRRSSAPGCRWWPCARRRRRGHPSRAERPGRGGGARPPRDLHRVRLSGAARVAGPPCHGPLNVDGGARKRIASLCLSPLDAALFSPQGAAVTSPATEFPAISTPRTTAEVPFFFESADRPLYGVFHPAAIDRAGAPVVVHCHSLGVEQLTYYRNDVLAARAAATLGFPVLRYHARGHGDSAGDFADVTLRDPGRGRPRGGGRGAAPGRRRPRDLARRAARRTGRAEAARRAPGSARPGACGSRCTKPADYCAAAAARRCCSRRWRAASARTRPSTTLLARLERDGRVDVHGYSCTARWCSSFDGTRRSPPRSNTGRARRAGADPAPAPPGAPRTRRWRPRSSAAARGSRPRSCTRSRAGSSSRTRPGRARELVRLTVEWLDAVA